MKNIILAFFIISLSITAVSQNYSGEISVQEPGFANEPKIYPNPCKQQKVTVEFTRGEISEIRLTNIAGKEVLYKKYEFTENKKQVQLTEIPDGIYLMRIKTAENKTVIKKLLVSKN